MLHCLRLLTMAWCRLVSNMLNRLHGQPESYDKKYAPISIESAESQHTDVKVVGRGTDSAGL